MGFHAKALYTRWSVHSLKNVGVDLHKRMTSWSQLCHKWLLLQTVSWRSFITTAPVLAGHSAVLPADTDCYALLCADRANIRTATICITDFFQKNRKMKMISNWMKVCLSWSVHASFWSVIRLSSMWHVSSSTADCLMWISVILLFTMPLHVMQCAVLPRSFCPSVRLSVKRVDSEKTKGMCAYILIPHERLFILVSDKKNGW